VSFQYYITDKPQYTLLLELSLCDTLALPGQSVIVIIKCSPKQMLNITLVLYLKPWTAEA
jgi:hypothetical protein